MRRAVLAAAGLTLLACPVGRIGTTDPSGVDVDGGSGGDGGADGALALEIGDGGLSMGRPGLAMFMGGPRHRGRSPHTFCSTIFSGT